MNNLYKIKIHLIFALFMFCSQTIIIGQEKSWPVLQEVRQAFSHQSPEDASITFIKNNSRTGVNAVSIERTDLYKTLVNTSSELLTIELPFEGQEHVIELIKVNLGGYRLTENANMVVSDIDIPICYRGVIRGIDEKHQVAMTVYNTGLVLTLYLPTKTLSVEPGATDYLPDQFATEYEINTKEEFAVDSERQVCGMLDTNHLYQDEIPSQSRAPQDKCIYVFIDCFDSLYLWRNSNYQQTINYVYELFNHVALGYANELINIKISEINIWTSTDPFGQANSTQALADLSSFYQDNYWGNICVGLDYSTVPTSSSRGGLAGAFGRVKGEYPNVCPSYTVPQHSFCYNDLNYTWVNVQNFPSGPITSQGQIYMVIHEIGHLLGSRHTQWCGWNLGGGNFGALDNCFATEGGCAPGPAPGAGGGTIMSYCVYSGQFVNFNNGFGPIPGGVVRSFVDNSACLSNCPSCPSDASINFSNVYVPNSVYRYEVSNTITATGLLISSEFAVMDAGVRITINPGFTASAGSNVHMVINGCGGIH